MTTLDLQAYKPMLVQNYIAKGLSKAEAENRAFITLQAAEYIGQMLNARHNTAAQIRQRGRRQNEF